MKYGIKQITAYDMSAYKNYVKTERGWECWVSTVKYDNLNKAFSDLSYRYDISNKYYVDGKDKTYYVVEEYDK